MRPIEKILSRLPDHRATADGFKAPCPTHEDLNPSLSIRETPRRCCTREMLRRMLPGKGRLWPRAAHGGPLSSQRRATLAGSAASEFSAATAAFRDRGGRDQWLRPRHARSPVDLRGCLRGRDRPDAPLEHDDRQGHSPCGQVRRRLAACGDAGAETAFQPARPAGQHGEVKRAAAGPRA